MNNKQKKIIIQFIGSGRENSWILKDRQVYICTLIKL